MSAGEANSRQSTSQYTVPRWQYEAWRRWFAPSAEARESRQIAKEAPDAA